MAPKVLLLVVPLHFVEIVIILMLLLEIRRGRHDPRRCSRHSSRDPFDRNSVFRTGLRPAPALRRGLSMRCRAPMRSRLRIDACHYLRWGKGSLLAVRQDWPAQVFWKNSDIATDYAWSTDATRSDPDDYKAGNGRRCPAYVPSDDLVGLLHDSGLDHVDSSCSVTFSQHET